jgi:DHA2 family multidrug resistance protein
MVSKGQEWDWLDDPSWRVQTLLIVFVLALVGFVCRELTFASPVVDFRVLRERNFAVSCGISFGALAVLYASSVALPLMLLTTFGYDAYAAGRVLWPAGVFAAPALLVTARLLGWRIDARWLIASGLLIMAAGNYWATLMNLQIGPSETIWPRVVTIIGLSLMFAPLNVAAFLYTPRPLRGAAVGLLALLRNEGGSFGVSMVQTIVERRNQFHTARMGDLLDAYNPEVSSFLKQTGAVFYQHTGDPAGSQQIALQSLADLRQQQAVTFAFLDVFWVAAVASLVLAFLVILMKPSAAKSNS